MSTSIGPSVANLMNSRRHRSGGKERGPQNYEERGPRNHWEVVHEKETFTTDFFINRQKIDNITTESLRAIPWPHDANRATIERKQVRVYENRTIRIPLTGDLEISKARVEVVNGQSISQMVFDIKGGSIAPAEIEATFKFGVGGLLLTSHNLHQTFQDSFKERVQFLAPEFGMLAKDLGHPGRGFLETAFNCLVQLKENQIPKSKYMLF